MGDVRRHRYSRAPRSYLSRRFICWTTGHKLEWFIDTWYKTRWAQCDVCMWLYPENDRDGGVKGWLARHAAHYNDMLKREAEGAELSERPMPY